MSNEQTSLVMCYDTSSQKSGTRSLYNPSLAILIGKDTRYQMQPSPIRSEVRIARLLSLTSAADPSVKQDCQTDHPAEMDAFEQPVCCRRWQSTKVGPPKEVLNRRTRFMCSNTEL